jgi:hypothetical protein
MFHRQKWRIGDVIYCICSRRSVKIAKMWKSSLHCHAEERLFEHSALRTSMALGFVAIPQSLLSNIESSKNEWFTSRWSSAQWLGRRQLWIRERERWLRERIVFVVDWDWVFEAERNCETMKLMLMISIAWLSLLRTWYGVRSGDCKGSLWRVHTQDSNTPRSSLEIPRWTMTSRVL